MKRDYELSASMPTCTLFELAMSGQVVAAIFVL
jgi:hypothetical protein